MRRFRPRALPIKAPKGCRGNRGQGYPIGSGVVEGACRHVVKDRMEGTGMHWCISGAQSMLHLRAIHLNGDWDTFQCYRIETATRQLYPYRPFVHRLYKKTG